MTHRTKQIALLSLTVALLTLLLLSSGLSNMQLQAAMPFPGSANSGNASPNVTPVNQPEARPLPVLEFLLGLLLIIMLIYIPARLVRLISLRNVLRAAAGLVLLLMLLGLLPRIKPGPPVVVANETSAPAARPSSNYETSPLGKPPPELLWITAGGIVLAAALLGGEALRKRRQAIPATDALLQHAEDALAALRAGKDFPNVIIRCYLEMSEILRDEQKMERERSMTPREFQDWLGSKGIPPGPVQQLTLLFERARYGREQMGPREEEMGRQCLSQIVQYCREAAR